MSSEQIIWLAGAAVAATFLLKMMRDRQVALNQLIRKSMEEKLRWSRKRAKAAKLARRTARTKAAEEKILGDILAADDSAVPHEKQQISEVPVPIPAESAN